MDTNVQPSFIPKKPLGQQTAVKPQRTISFFSLIANVIFITSVVLAIGIFGYEKYLQSQLLEKKADLEAKIEEFDRALVAELSRLDSRLTSAQTLLNNHVALSAFFDIVDDLTLETVRFTSFSYSAKGSGDVLSIIMGGQAKNFASVALQQAEVLKSENEKYFTNPVFSDLNLDKDGNVTFKFTSFIKKPSFSYSALMKEDGVSVTATEPASEVDDLDALPE
jgi:hypothetical protein